MSEIMQEIYNRKNDKLEDITIVYYFDKLKISIIRFELKPEFREVEEEIMSESIEGSISILHYIENQRVSHIVGNGLWIIYDNVSLIKFASSKDDDTLNFEVYSEKDKEK